MRAAPILILALSVQPAWADCTGATDRYNTAVEEVAYQLKRYARCVRDSDGADDCAMEFGRLRNSQTDFEGAVADRQSECR
ncbi:hypothetical protein [Methylobacterium nodulans]|uniref:Uncharacterized protein n=1 Tax=Methylobacterium nodulans (strain LMG 21967 / CNCM I-2342 / ORS 2060) TaxID=460265 RepID=B8IQF7_METNO|nr:hypothetical protein [Methylobacterium nodulans]ACL60469.1 conserved hypothetical protein [Methylobacterium nodulans ORS 2060]